MVIIGTLALKAAVASPVVIVNELPSVPINIVPPLSDEYPTLVVVALGNIKH